MNSSILWLAVAVLGGLCLYERFPGFVVTAGLFALLLYPRGQWMRRLLRLTLPGCVPAQATAVAEGGPDGSAQTDREEEKLAEKEGLVERLGAVGLSSQDQLPEPHDEHGVTSTQALEHQGYEGDLKLECQVQPPWEKPALRQRLNTAESKAITPQWQEEHLAIGQKQKEQGEAALPELEEMQHKDKMHQNKAVRTEQEQQVTMKIPQEFREPSEKPRMKATENVHTQLHLLPASVSQSETLPDGEVVRRASGGLALQGIYKTHKLTDMLEKREQLINIPEGFKLFVPYQEPFLETKEIPSAAAESTFTQTMETLGYSLSLAATGGFGGVSAETSTDGSSSSESEGIHRSHSERTYLCTTRYSYIPLASCYFPKDRLRLSSAALQELKEIEQRLSDTSEPDKLPLLKSRAGNFFKRFGSHVNQGPLHLGGIFWWKAASQGFRAEQLDKVKKQASDELRSYVGGSYSGLGWGIAAGVTASKSESEASFQGTDRKQEQTEIQLRVTKTGGPPGVDSLAAWKSGLLASNKTWSVIDRGSQLTPVWDIILANHRQDFKDVYQIGRGLMRAYEALTNLSASPLAGEGTVSAVEEARSFLEEVKTWEVTGEEGQLVTLLKFKEQLMEKTNHNSTWIDICLSDRGLQDFLANTVLLCKELPVQNLISITFLLRCLLHPHVHLVRNFPQSTSIMQWLLHTENKHLKTIGSSEFADFAKTLQEMKNYLQEVTDDTMSSAAAVQGAKVKATLNVSWALSSLLLTLREREQTDMELLLLCNAASAGYCVDSHTFLCLLGCPEINFLLKEMQRALDVAIKRQKFSNLIERLGLDNYYPRKMGTADFHIIHSISLRDSQPSMETDLPLYFLQKLLMLDYRVRYLVCKSDSETKVGKTTASNTSDKVSESSDIFDNFFRPCSAGTNEPARTSQTHVHPMDLQMAIFHCADDFMRQYVATKLAFCQFALPLLVPNPHTAQIEFPLWALSQVQKSWKGTKKSGEQTNIKNYNTLIYQAETPLVSFTRIGQLPHSSKSQILNALLSKHKHDVFFHRHCRGSSRDCLLMKGVVEIAWYCPGGKDDDRFDNCVAFTNLHGDVREHEPQATFLQEIASVNVVLLSDMDQKDTRSKAILRDLWQSTKPLICLFAEKDNTGSQKSGQNIGIGIKDRNEAELIDEITATIRDLLAGSIITRSLDACVTAARWQGFLVDADKEECKEAKAKAQELTGLLKEHPLASMKGELLPLQGELWHRWCRKDKELTHLKEKSDRSIEQHRSKIESEKAAIRRDQLSKVTPLNTLMKSVLEFLHSHPEASQKFFLQWMKVFMDDLSSNCLTELHQQYHTLWSEILIKKKEVNCSKTQLQNNLDKLSAELNDSTIGLEHIWRETGQIYEALDAMNKRDKRFLKLPQIAADLMVSGYPMELMDGDASYVPLKWVRAVFNSVIEKLGDKKVFVLSVLGIQSTGKSTLLNAMFGLQFSVSAGRCTRGAFMQLIKVEENLQQDLNFDYILVVDTEGLRAIEMANNLSLSHDNELATFVIGLGNMTLINIFGENPSEMQDILQIAVQAFLRMKQVKLSPSCLFVHQNVGEITANEKNMEGRRRLQQKLDEMAVTAAQQERCDVTCFSDVIRFDVNTHIHYFAHLWEGDPPMAPPNPSYSQNVQELKSKILMAAKQESQGRVLRLSELKDRIGDLWQALLNENFVFSFKNTLEIAAYNRLETEFSQWSWQLRSHMLELQIKLNNQIRNREMLQITRESLEGAVREKYTAVTDQLEKFFREDPEAEILIQWKANMEMKLKELKTALIDETKRKSEELIRLREQQSKLDERKAGYEKELFKRSQELALSLKGKKLSDNELRKNFNRLWNEWVCEVASGAPPTQEPNISLDTENILLERFEQNSAIVEKFKACSSDRFHTDFSKHVTLKRSGLFRSQKKLEECDRDYIEQVTGCIIQKVQDILKRKERDRLDYSPSYIHEILNTIRQEEALASKNLKFTFNPEYTADLSVFLCKMAGGRFEAMHRAFKEAHDPIVYLESKREDFFKCFQISCQGATSITAFAEVLRSKLAAALRPAIYDRTAIDIAREMKATLPAFSGNRSNLENHILVSLAEKENFAEYRQYIQYPKCFFEGFIKQHVKDYCLDKNPKLQHFLNNSLDSFRTLVLSVICDSTQVTKDQSGNVSFWLDEFCRRLQTHLILPRSELKSIEHQEVTDMEFLKEALSKALAPVVENLQKDFAAIDMEPFPRKPHEILAEQLGGCWEQCPLCSAVCTNTISGHDGKHSVPFHRPQGVGGWRFHTTDYLVTYICSSLVSSDKHFRLADDRRIPYKSYWEGGEPYSEWSITPDMSEQPYWKWFVCRFKTDLEKLYGKKFEGLGEIPSQWKSIDRDAALRELKNL